MNTLGFHRYFLSGCAVSKNEWHFSEAIPLKILRMLRHQFSLLGIAVFLVWYTGMNQQAEAQVASAGRPVIDDRVPVDSIPAYVIQSSGFQPEITNGKAWLGLKPACSGMLEPVWLSPSTAGKWTMIPGGLRVWRLAIHCPGASSMSAVFSSFELARGVRLYLYNSSRSRILGAFTLANNRKEGPFATGEVPGDRLVLELQVPRYVNDFGKLILQGVGCDFSLLANDTQGKDGWFGISGACNEDLACREDADYQQMKHAVVRIVFQGVERCTGVLVNNTAQNGRNFVITAEHCISREIDANTALFYFDYESPSCEGSDGSSLKSVSGATIRATGEDIDFTLLELLEPLPFYYHPVYAGWNMQGQPPQNGYVIHHPLGDVKKISIEADQLVSADYGSLYKYNTHWLVRRWETGTTEAGSSGAPFFDQDNRVAGTLSGGQANCLNSINDYFQKFSSSWDTYADADRQLRYWLDPKQTETETLDAFDPYCAFWQTGDTLSNILTGEEKSGISHTLAWGSLSGHNSDLVEACAEAYQVEKEKSLMGIIIEVDQNEPALQERELTVNVWEGTNLPGKVLYSKQVYFSDLAAGFPNYIPFDSLVYAGKNFFVGYELNYGSPMDTFSVLMASSRETSANHTAFIKKSAIWQSLADYTGNQILSSYAVYPIVYDSLPEISPPIVYKENLAVYPNPSQGFVELSFRRLDPGTGEIFVYNLQGLCVLRETFGTYLPLYHLNLSHLSDGMYLIRVKQSTSESTAKVIIAR